MTRFLSFVVGSLMILYSVACSYQTASRQNSQVAPTPIKDLGTDEGPIGAKSVLIAGTFNRETRELQISRGLREPRAFQNLDAGLKALEDAGYKRPGLQQLRGLLLTDSQKETGPTEADEEVLDPSDVLSAFEVIGAVVRFTIFDIDLSKYAQARNVGAALEQNRSQGGCERISKSCIKCPNGKIYCVIEQVKEVGDR